jgi:hypothetical protein
VYKSQKKHLDCDHDYARFGHKCGWAARASPDTYILMGKWAGQGKKEMQQYFLHLGPLAYLTSSHYQVVTVND